MSRGAACSNSNPLPPPPPVPLQTPKVFEPVFVQFEVLGESVGAEGAPKFFCPPEGLFFFLPCVSIHKILRILWRIEEWVKNTEKNLTPDLTSGSALG